MRNDGTAFALQTARPSLGSNDHVKWRSRLQLETLRWLDIVFQGQYLPSLSVNYVAINKDLEKLTPQLY